MAQCRCFLEYLSQFNLTAKGLWICHDTHGVKYNNMLRQVMPDAAPVENITIPASKV